MSKQTKEEIDEWVQEVLDSDARMIKSIEGAKPCETPAMRRLKKKNNTNNDKNKDIPQEELGDDIL